MEIESLSSQKISGIDYKFLKGETMVDTQAVQGVLDTLQRAVIQVENLKDSVSGPATVWLDDYQRLILKDIGIMMNMQKVSAMLETGRLALGPAHGKLKTLSDQHNTTIDQMEHCRNLLRLTVTEKNKIITD